MDKGNRDKGKKKWRKCTCCFFKNSGLFGLCLLLIKAFRAFWYCYTLYIWLLPPYFDLGGVIINLDPGATIRAFESLGAARFSELYTQLQQSPVFDLYDK